MGVEGCAREGDMVQAVTSNTGNTTICSIRHSIRHSLAALFQCNTMTPNIIRVPGVMATESVLPVFGTSHREVWFIDWSNSLQLLTLKTTFWRSFSLIW